MKKLLLLLIFVFPMVSYSAANLGNGESCLRDGECISGEVNANTFGAKFE